MSEIAITGDVVEETTAVTRFDLSQADGLRALKQAEAVVGYMAAKCQGPKFLSTIQGKQYPLVTWWTTVGAALGLFPQEVSSTKRDTEVMSYEAVVEVRHGDQVVSRASAICSKDERTWRDRDEYAIKSMATTRATGKAYRIAFAFLAVMAGLEPTPAEEMPVEETKVEPIPTHHKVRPADQRKVVAEIIAIVLNSHMDEDEKAVVRRAIEAATTLEALVAIKDFVSGEEAQRREMDTAADAGFKAAGP